MARNNDPAVLLPQALDGDRRALARLLTLVEDLTPEGAEILRQTFLTAGQAWTTGLTGAPGAGKSTLTDRLITWARLTGDVAVLAVDPSSPFTGGATLGDRVRMQDHIDDRGVYIRSMASRGHLGGIAEATPKLLTVLDGIGFPELFVETVGVGQSEVDVAAAADTTVVVLNPGWGDSIQAAKAGLLEVGDIFVVNKGDRPGVDDTVRDLRQMLELGVHSGWLPPIIVTTATAGDGIGQLTDALRSHRTYLQDSLTLGTLRERRLLTHLELAISDAVNRQIRELADDDSWGEITAAVLARKIDPWSAARELVAS